MNDDSLSRARPYRPRVHGIAGVSAHLEQVCKDQIRVAETHLLATGVEPDEIDAVIAAYREELTTWRAEVVAKLDAETGISASNVRGQFGGNPGVR